MMYSKLTKVAVLALPLMVAIHGASDKMKAARDLRVKLESADDVTAFWKNPHALQHIQRKMSSNPNISVFDAIWEENFSMVTVNILKARGITFDDEESGKKMSEKQKLKGGWKRKMTGWLKKPSKPIVSTPSPAVAAYTYMQERRKSITSGEDPSMNPNIPQNLPMHLWQRQLEFFYQQNVVGQHANLFIQMKHDKYLKKKLPELLANLSDNYLERYNQSVQIGNYLRNIPRWVEETKNEDRLKIADKLIQIFVDLVLMESKWLEAVNLHGFKDLGENIDAARETLLPIQAEVAKVNPAINKLLEDKGYTTDSKMTHRVKGTGTKVRIEQKVIGKENKYWVIDEEGVRFGQYISKLELLQKNWANADRSLPNAQPYDYLNLNKDSSPWEVYNASKREEIKINFHDVVKKIEHLLEDDLVTPTDCCKRIPTEKYNPEAYKVYEKKKTRYFNANSSMEELQLKVNEKAIVRIEQKDANQNVILKKHSSVTVEHINGDKIIVRDESNKVRRVTRSSLESWAGILKFNKHHYYPRVSGHNNQKKFPRAAYKTIQKYNGNPLKLKDINRVSFCFPDLESLKNGFQKIMNSPYQPFISRIKNRLPGNAVTGYLDILMNIVLVDDTKKKGEPGYYMHIAEVQLHVLDAMKAKIEVIHKQYDDYRYLNDLERAISKRHAAKLRESGVRVRGKSAWELNVEPKTKSELKTISEGTEKMESPRAAPMRTPSPSLEAGSVCTDASSSHSGPADL